MHAWFLIHTCLQLVLFVDRSALLCFSSDINYSLEQGKSQVIVEVKDVKPSTKKKKKLKMNSHTREESREENDAQLPNLKPRNFQTKWLMITSRYGSKITGSFVTLFG